MQAFYAIVQEGNISHAAERLGIAQPALSRQMKRLEGSLGVSLFERGSRRIKLTEAGRLLSSRVEHILGLVDGTVREITDIGEGVAGTLRIGTITTSGAKVLPGLIEKFRELYPRVMFQIWESEGARVMELVDNRVVEISITRTQADPGLYDSIILPNEPLVLIMRKNDPIGSDPDTIRLSELKDRPMIIPLRWRPVFMANCKKQGFEPDVICISDSIVQDILLTKRGVGYSLVPVSAESLLTEGDLMSKKLIDPEISTHTIIAWRNNRTLSSAAEHFLKLLREIYADEIAK